MTAEAAEMVLEPVFKFPLGLGWIEETDFGEGDAGHGRAPFGKARPAARGDARAG